MKPPISLSNAQLQAYADEHIKYEIEMLQWTSATLSPMVPIKQQGPMAWTISNGLLNSYAIQARNLIDFLYLRSSGKDRSNDIVVHDYIDDAILATTLPPMTPLLEQAKVKADKQVAHLTLKRKEYEGAGKEWHFINIAADIMDAFYRISSAFPASKTSDAFRQLIARPNLYLPVVATELIRTADGQAVGLSLRIELSNERPA